MDTKIIFNGIEDETKKLRMTKEQIQRLTIPQRIDTTEELKNYVFKCYNDDPIYTIKFLKNYRKAISNLNKRDRKRKLHKHRQKSFAE